MAEAAIVYDMLVKIGVEEHVAEVFHTLSMSLGAIESALARVVTQLPRTAEQFGLLGGTLIGISAAAATAGWAFSELGNKGAEALAKFQLEGVTSKEMLNDITRAAQATAAAIPGTTISGNIELLRQLRGVMGGDTSKAIEMLPKVALFNRLTESEAGVGAIQALGGKTAGPDQLKQLDDYMQMIMKIVQASAGALSPQQVAKQFQFGGLGSQQYSKEFMEGFLPRLMVDASAGGGGARGLTQQLNVAMQEALKAAGGKHPHELMEGIKVDIANPQLMAAALADKLKAAGVTAPADVAAKLSEIFTGSRGARAGQPIFEMVMAALGKPEDDRFKQMTKAVEEAPGGSVQALHDYMRGSPVEQAHELEVAFRNLGEAMAIPLAQMRTEAMSHIIDMLNAMSKATSNISPEAMDHIIKIIGALVLGIGALGVAVAGIAIAAVAGLPALIAGVVAAISALILFEWPTIEKGMLAATKALQDFVAYIISIPAKVLKFLHLGGTDEPSAADKSKENVVPPDKQGLTPGSIGSPMNYVAPPASTGPRLIDASFNPGGGTSRPVMVAMTLNIDGRTLAQAVSTQLANLSDHPTQAPTDDANRGFHTPGDSQYTSV